MDGSRTFEQPQKEQFGNRKGKGWSIFNDQRCLFTLYLLSNTLLVFDDFSCTCMQVDVYSFGIVMWELLTGEEPYADLRSEEIIGNVQFPYANTELCFLVFE